MVQGLSFFQHGSEQHMVQKGSFVVSGGVGFCNAVRRTLLSDVQAWAPAKLTVKHNSTCQTDEYLAHRIGLVPFRRIEAHGASAPLTLDRTGPCTVVAADILGSGFSPVYGTIEIMELGPGHRLHVEIHMDCQPAHVHARYAVCAAVGMCKVDAERCRITFETNDDSDPKLRMAEALDHLEARVDRALQALAHQPSVPPQTFC